MSFAITNNARINVIVHNFGAFVSLSGGQNPRMEMLGQRVICVFNFNRC